MIEKKKLGNTVCELRKSHNYSQADIGKLLNVSDSLVSKWENGSCDIDLQYLDSLAKLFDMTIDEIIKYQEKKDEENRKKQENERRLLQEKNAAIQKKLGTYEGFLCKAWDKAKGFCREARILTEYDGEKLVIHQNEDPSIVLYDSAITIFIDNDASCEVFFNNKWEDCRPNETQRNSWFVPFDFNHRIERIRFSFDQPEIEDYEIEVVFIPADKNAWLEKTRKEKRAELLTRMDMHIIKNPSPYPPINIVFHPASADFSYAVIELYFHRVISIPIDEYNCKNEEYYDLLKSYRIPDGELIWTNTDLVVTNKYLVALKQFDKNNDLIIESDKKPLA